jgi:DNA-directed RNA polymerase subunit RPC12/RpoP
MAMASIENAEQLTCPHCGFVDLEAKELFVDQEIDERSVTCKGCSHPYYAVRVIEVRYTSFTDYDEKPESA